MRRVLALILVVAVVIAAFAIVARWRARCADVGPPTVLVADDRPAGLPAAAAQAPGDPPSRLAAETRGGLPEGTELVVRVVRADGTTAPGATLTLFVELGGGPAELSKPAGEFGWAVFSRDEIRTLVARDERQTS